MFMEVELLSVVFFCMTSVIVLIAVSMKRLEEGERGIKYTLGKPSGEMEPGVNIVIPIMQSYKVVKVVPEKREVVAEARSVDKRDVRAFFELEYEVEDVRKAMEKGGRSGDYRALVEGKVRELFGKVAKREKMLVLMGEREEIAGKVLVELHNEIPAYGLRVTRLKIKDVDVR
jgi:regulator of protease activity HflC (stomatin/prohibitin superfamily)